MLESECSLGDPPPLNIKTPKSSEAWAEDSNIVFRHRRFCLYVVPLAKSRAQLTKVNRNILGAHFFIHEFLGSFICHFLNSRKIHFDMLYAFVGAFGT